MYIYIYIYIYILSLSLSLSAPHGEPPPRDPETENLLEASRACSPLVCVTDVSNQSNFSESLISLSWLSGALVGVGGYDSDFIG